MTVKFATNKLADMVVDEYSSLYLSEITQTNARRPANSDTEIYFDQRPSYNQQAIISTPKFTPATNNVYFHVRSWLPYGQYDSGTAFEFYSENDVKIGDMRFDSGKASLRLFDPTDGSTVLASQQQALTWEADAGNIPNFSYSSNLGGTLIFRVEVNGSQTAMTMHRDGSVRLEIPLTAAAHQAMSYVKIISMAEDGRFSEILMEDGEFPLGYSVATLKPTANGNYTDFTGNYDALLSETDSNDLIGTGAGQRFTWIASDYGGAVTDTVKWLSVSGKVTTNSSGPTSVRQIIRDGSVDYVGATENVGAANEAELKDVWALHPGTGVAWTVAQINGLEVGYETL